MKWRKIRLRMKTQRLFSRNYQILIEEVTHNFKTFICFSLFMLHEPNEEREPEMITTDADTVKELVEMKFLTKKRKIRFRTPQQRIV